MTVRVWSIGLKQICVMARGGMKRSFSTSPGDPRQKMIESRLVRSGGTGYRLSQHLRVCARIIQQALRVSLHSVRYGPTAFLTGFPKRFANSICRRRLAVVLGVRAATQRIPAGLALPAFLQSFVANLVNAGVRLLPLGQTDGQRALAALEEAVLAASEQTKLATLDDLGSAAFMVDLSSMAHETQYTRLFRS